MATITNLQGSTQIWNSDEIINQNFQNINNAIVEKTGNQTIAWIKTFTDVEFIHDVTNNTENPKMRKLAAQRKVKNQNDAGWVDRTIHVDADNSIVWNRKRSLRWYLKKRADWSYWSYESFITCEFPTYDGNTTYTKKTTIASELTVWNQDWTGAWTSYTPARHSGITVSWFTLHYVDSASYKQIGKTVFVQTYLAFTATSTGNTLNITLPKTVVWKHFAWVTWMWWGATFNHMWYCDWSDDTFHFEASFTSGTYYSIMFSATYETE